MKILNAFLIFLVISCFFPSFLNAGEQTFNAKNTVFLELAGKAGNYSINYDRIFWEQNKSIVSAGIGFAPSLIDKEWDMSPRIPIQVNYFYKIHNNHYGEAGIGYTPYWNKYRGLRNLLFTGIGYRYQILEGGLFIKANFSPLIFENGFTFIPWGSLGIGMSL